MNGRLLDFFMLRLLGAEFAHLDGPHVVLCHLLRFAERPYNQSQKLTPGPDAEWNLEVTLQATHHPELERWLMGYDQDFDVIEPA